MRKMIKPKRAKPKPKKTILDLACPKCKLNANMLGYFFRLCSQCKIEALNRSKSNPEDAFIVCPFCKGKGEFQLHVDIDGNLIGDICPVCDGAGRRAKDEVGKIKKKCTLCGGRGKTSCTSHGWILDREDTCKWCEGEGKV